MDVVRFIPDSDLAAAAPYLNDRGGITGAPLGEGQSQERDRLVEVFQRHRADGERLLDRALIRGGGPIGESVWTLQTRRPDPRFGYFREGGGGYDGRR